MADKLTNAQLNELEREIELNSAGVWDLPGVRELIVRELRAARVPPVQRPEGELRVIRWGNEVGICLGDDLVFEIAPDVDPEVAEALARSFLPRGEGQ